MKFVPSVIAVIMAMAGAAAVAAEPAAAPSQRTSAAPRWEACAWQEADPADPYRRMCRQNETGEYRFRIPASIDRHPIVRTQVDRVNAELADGMDMVARQDRDDAKAAGLAFTPWLVELDWKLAGLNEHLASLIGHATLAPRPSRRPKQPDENAISILVDQKTGRFLTAASDAFSDQMDSVRATYCTHLDIQRIANALDADPTAGSKGKPPIIDSAGRYLGKWQCPYMDDLAIGFAGSAGEPFDRIILMAQPMIAGPEHEGFYRVDLPLTSAMVENIRPEYRAGFRAAKMSEETDPTGETK